MDPIIMCVCLGLILAAATAIGLHRWHKRRYSDNVITTVYSRNNKKLYATRHPAKVNYYHKENIAKITERPPGKRRRISVFYLDDLRSIKQQYRPDVICGKIKGTF